MFVLPLEAMVVAVTMKTVLYLEAVVMALVQHGQKMTALVLEAMMMAQTLKMAILIVHHQWLMMTVQTSVAIILLASCHHQTGQVNLIKKYERSFTIVHISIPNDISPTMMNYIPS